MAGRDLGVGLKLKYSFYSTLVYLLVTSPLTYRFTQQLFGGAITILQNGIPTPAGYFLHALVFFALIFAIMMFPRDV